MYGFLTPNDNFLRISNRIFETLLYNYFLSVHEMKNKPISCVTANAREKFIKEKQLDMEYILERYVMSFHDIYGEIPEPFDEEEGRRRFLLFLRPIINGTGNYYIEARTRNNRRMDIVVDYLGKRYVIELKIWRGNAYHERGEEQLFDYLSYYQIEKGYMLSYNVNKSKETGLWEIHLRDKILVEAVV